HVLAGAKRHGLTWGRPAWSRDGEPLKVELRLPPEQTLKARLIDLQGQPAAGVKVRVLRVMSATLQPPQGWKGQYTMPRGADADFFSASMRRQQGYEFPKSLTRKDWPLLPQEVTTDDKGRLTVRGFGRGQELVLLVEDDRFALQELSLKTDDDG